MENSGKQMKLSERIKNILKLNILNILLNLKTIILRSQWTDLKID